MSEFDYDVVIVGSGFGGSVSALRLTEKGYKVLVLESGRRFADDQFAKNSWHLREYLWAPKLGCYGIQRINLLRNSLVLAGAGVGGGSLVYANTLYEPLDPFYEDPAWSHITDWKSELAPYYDQAKRMLGVNPVAQMTPADTVVKEAADRLGYGDSFHFAPVGVLFGEDEGQDVGDPYFGGVGPSRRTCINCGECMSGCRHNAKNTLVKNYLYLAEQAGAEVRELTTVFDVRPIAGGGYEVHSKSTKPWRGKQPVIRAEQVVFSAASLGTQRLLHRLRDSGSLPNISDRLGLLTRTNSEALMGSVAMHREVDYTRGVAITSSIHPDATTHIEPVRYGKGSNVMMFVQMVLSTDGSGTDEPSLKTVAKNILKLGPRLPKLYDAFHWSERTVIALVMQARDNSITTYTKRRLFGGRKMTTKQGTGEPNPTYIASAHRAVTEMADYMDGVPGGIVTEPIGIPMTAHFLGGCAIGDSPQTGVIDPYQRLYGHEGLHVIDGAAITANLGVNPSLTITAQAERAVSLWPNRGEPDQRPALGQLYRRLDPVLPKNPVVPVDAPAAYRLPIVGVS
ncbi:GMC family oxidoreductase [Aeromicrobium duanguangcaii]|uniref:Cholesterol oxidase n=1 Tax=Aeromicrobium duanguangcaii TaxID=2968086 RepID=A0ABY5KF62_9ACTN|nr:GMC family oxidoreductase [Aeromicrobium duanguangcaii]MCD9153826.1 GMC family oxidoreductase [Aeromicrobium duanguangcaii]UUI69092.1 GMC family oxidoreductase [Aeromicrobium duanguangcaii]